MSYSVLRGAVWGVIFVLPMVLWPALASAQSDATLRIVVISTEDGNPIPGATLILAVPDGDTLRTGATNRDGYREFTGLSPGDYELTVSFVGYETYREVLSLTPGTRIHRVGLSIQPEELEEVVVEGARGAARRVAGLQTITGRDLRRIPTPGPGGDLASYLQSMPGVVSTGDRGGELFIRGGTPSQNLVLVDNLPIVKPFHISNLFSAFPEEVVQTVDLYAGGFGAEYIGATSSVLDVTLRPGNMRAFRGGAAASPYMVALHMEGPIQVDRHSFLGMVRRSTLNETAGFLTGEEVPIDFYDVTARYSLQHREASCSITTVHTYDRGQINPIRNIMLSWSNTTVGGRCFAFGEQFNRAYEVSLGYSGFQNRESTPNADERFSGLHRLHVNVDHGRELFGHQFDYGAGWSLGWYSAELSERFTSIESFSSVVSTYTGYTSAAWEWGDRLTITPSLGLHLSSQRLDRPAVEPRLRVTYRPGGTDQQEVSLAVGKYHQTTEGITDERDAGTVFAIWKPSDEEDPLPGALHGIVGFRQRVGSDVEISLEGYLKRHTNIPVSRWTPEAGLTVETTVAHGFTQGVDARVEVDRGPFYLFLGYALSSVRYEAATDDLGAWVEETVFGYSPAHDQRHQLNTVLSYELGDFTTSMRWEFSSGRPFTRVYGFDLALDLPDDYPLTHPGRATTLFHRPYDARMPTYHRFDMSVEWTFEPAPSFSIDAQVGAINLYDRRNVFYFDVNTLQRVDQIPLMPYVSLSIRWD